MNVGILENAARELMESANELEPGDYSRWLIDLSARLRAICEVTRGTEMRCNICGNDHRTEDHDPPPDRLMEIRQRYPNHGAAVEYVQPADLTWLIGEVLRLREIIESRDQDDLERHLFS